MKARSYYLNMIFILLGTLSLTDSRAFFAPYLLAALVALFCLGKNRSQDIDRRSRKYVILVIVSLLSAVFIALANYALWLYPALPETRGPVFVRLYKLIMLLVIMAGAFFCTLDITEYTVYEKDALTVKRNEKSYDHPFRFFIIPFAIILTVYLVIYFGCYYPGLMSLDSMDQVTQVFSGQYSNHQPFYHTLLIGVFLRAGLAIWGNINSAVALYTVFQIVFMAATFSFVIYNLAIYRLPKWTMITATVWYALMPYHIMYSFTVWKDVYFGASVTLLILFFARIMHDRGNGIFNYTGFCISGLVMCLIRSNGLFSYVFVFLAVLFLLRRKKNIVFVMAATIVICFIMKHSVLSAFSVTPPDTVESLSIPLQQVARVVAEDGNMLPEDTELLSNILDVSELKETYDPDISDPVKNMIRDFGNQDFLKENLSSFGMLYFRTFLRNPMRYVTAWVDSTCGYWNSGYDYWIWYWDVEENTHGIVRTVNSQGLLHFMDEYLWLYYNNTVLQIFTAMGMFTWMILLVLVRDISKNDRTGIIMTVPILAIVLSLVISSPVYSEFRYMYALFCALPLFIIKEEKD